MERVIARRLAGLLRGCGRGPCRRSVYRSTVRTDGDDVGQLALRRKVAGNVRIVCCRPFKMFGDSHVGIEHKHRFPKLMAKCVNSSCLIGIACYQNKAVGIRAHCIDKGCDRKVYVRSFFFEFHDMRHACMGFFASLAFPVDVRKPYLLFAVEPFNDFHSAKCSQCLEIYLLPFLGCNVMRICPDACREKLDRTDFVFLLEHGGNERTEVEPFAVRRFFQQAIVEIVAVDINKCLFIAVLKCKGPQPFGRSPRAASAEPHGWNTTL